MVSAADRLSLLAVHAGNVNLRTLSQMLGLKTPQMLYDVMSGKVAGISGRLANKIFLAFPEVNQKWVMTGEGDMLTSEAQKEEMEHSAILTSPEAWKILLNMSDTIARQEDNISKLTDIIKTMATTSMNVEPSAN